MEQPLPADIENLLQDLQPEQTFNAVRKGAAKGLGQLRVSDLRVVKALIATMESDPALAVRKQAAESLLAPAHQELVQQHPDLMNKVLEMQAVLQHQSAPPRPTPPVERRVVAPRIESDERLYVREEMRLIQQGEIEGKSFGVRAVAYIIDIIAVNVLQLVGSLGGGLSFGLIAAITGEQVVFEEQSLAGLEFFIIGMVLSILYFTLLESWFGASLGKVILRMRVVKTDGEPCDTTAAFVRALLRLIDGFFFGIPAAVNMEWPLQQRLGDRAAHTVVVSSKSTFIQNPRPWWTFPLATALYLLLVSATVGMVLFIVNTGAAQDLPDLSEVVLTPQDFLQDFVELSPDQLGLQVGQSAGGDIDVESAFGLLRLEPFEMIWGFTGLLATESEQASFDRDTRRKDAMLALLVQGMEAEEGDILEQAVLSDLDVIGDASLGVTIVVDSGDAILRLDVVGFRRDVVGAFVYVSYLNGEIPLVPVDDVAHKLDAHIIEALR